MGRWLGLSVLCALAVGGSGCATIAHGTRQTVTVASNPPGAVVTVLTAKPGQPAVVRSRPGVTPIDVSLTRRDPHLLIRLEKEGCAPAEIRLKRSASGWIAGNLIAANPFAMQGMSHPETQYPMQLAIGVPLLFGIDALSGGAFKLPRRIDADLCRGG